MSSYVNKKTDHDMFTKTFAHDQEKPNFYPPNFTNDKANFYPTHVGIGSVASDIAKLSNIDSASI